MDLRDITYYDHLPALPEDGDSQINFTIEKEKEAIAFLGIGEILDTTDFQLMDDGTSFAIFGDSAMALPEGVSEETDRFIAYRPALLKGRAFKVIPSEYSPQFPAGGLYWAYDSDNPRWTLKWLTAIKKIPLTELATYKHEANVTCAEINP
jgi:hypothetical protein